jgi:predicted nucleotidyltransferase
LTNRDSAVARLDPRAASYIADVARVAGEDGSLASLVLFGSAATGGYARSVSDVDLLIVLHDDTVPAARERIRDAVERLEQEHGLAKQRHAGSALATALTSFADRVTANVRTFFICTRGDLLSGDPARILGVPALQAAFVDGVAIPSIVGSGVTVHGEDLLSEVPLPDIRRSDVAKAFFGLLNHVLFTVATYPVLPAATRYAMDALKRSVHNCYFCYHARPAALKDEVAWFRERYGPDAILDQLLRLREDYGASPRFVIGCIGALVRLHWRTARDVRFPRPARPAPVAQTASIEAR